jgi:pilus assembly protein FimV
MYRPRRARGSVYGLGLIVALAFVLPGVAHALGLGSLKVNSALNEPLNAEIDLTSASKKELKSLNVGLAGRREFNDAGVNRAAFLTDIKFTIAKRLDGRPFLQLTSEQPIREPFLHFLVQVEWAGGRIVREFTALIDPPYMLAGRSPAVTAPASAPATEPAPAPQAAPAPTPAPAAAEALTETAAAPTITEIEPAPPVVEPSPAPEPMMAAAPPPQPSEPLGPSTTGEVSISPDTGWPEGTSTETAVAEAGATVEGAGPAPMPSTAMASPEGAPSWATMARYEVKRGDTLWSIAQRVRLDDRLSTEQVIMALYEANRHAFFRNNVNNVWAGKVLIIPEHEEVLGLSRQDARSVFLAQYNEWQEYKIQLAQQEQLTIAESSEASAAAPAVTSETPAVEMTPTVEEPTEQTQIAAKEPEQETPAAAQEVIEEQPKQESTPAAQAATSAPRAAPPRDLLKIVRAAIDDADKGRVAEGESDKSQSERVALAERATTLDEAFESKQMEQQELGERIGTVGSQLERQKRLMELENGTLAKTQESTTESEATPKPQPTTPSKPAEQAAATEKPTTTETAAADSVPPPAAKTTEPDKPRARRRIRRDTARPAPRKAKPRRIVPTPPPEEKGFVAKIQEAVGDYIMQAAAAIILIVLGFIGLIYFRRRRQAAAEFEESILTDSDAITDSATTDSGTPATTSAGSTSFLSDFSQGGMGNISTDEVDPLAETEVYLAYGRDEQAEEILKDAVAKDPSRHELKVKLLEIYSQRNDVPAFETLAEELYAAQEGRGGDLWNRVAEMGRKLNPDNPMFHVAMPETTAMPQTPYAMPQEEAAPESEAAPVLDFEPPTDERMPAFDLDMGMEESVPPTEATADTGLEFELDMDAGTAAPDEEASVAEEPPIPDTAELSAEELAMAAFEQEEEAVGLGEQPGDNVLDFDITEGRGTGADTGPDTALAEADAQLQFDADSDLAVDQALADAITGTEDAQQWDETATKLDLAKAYVDMGDAEGARSILDEVLAEGNEDQKKQAAELAAQIA